MHLKYCFPNICRKDFAKQFNNLFVVDILRSESDDSIMHSSVSMLSNNYVVVNTEDNLDYNPGL